MASHYRTGTIIQTPPRGIRLSAPIQSLLKDTLDMRAWLGPRAGKGMNRHSLVLLFACMTNATVLPGSQMTFQCPRSWGLCSVAPKAN